jgi:hypothetical protein
VSCPTSSVKYRAYYHLYSSKIRCLKCSVSVIDRLFILPSMPLQHSPAYLFTTNSALVPSDGGDSWADYIPRHPSHGFTTYALRLTLTLRNVFALGLRLQTAFPLHSPLIIRSLLDGFATDSSFNSFAFNRLLNI